MSQLRVILNCLLIVSSIGVVAQDSARTVQYHSQDIVPIRAKLGGTGTGKTTLLRILADFIPDHDRIVVIEDTSELHIQKPNIVPTECRDRYVQGQHLFR